MPMHVDQGDDPIVLTLSSPRGSLELTEKQCVAIRAAGTPPEVAGPLNMPKPPQGVRLGVYIPAAPAPATQDGSRLYWLIHGCLIDPDGYWRGGSHDMTRAVLDVLDRNSALFAQKAMSDAAAVGFRDGAADMEKRTLAERATLAEEVARLQKQVARLQGFKQLVHERLSEMGVPSFPMDPCRIGARLTFLQEKLAAALGPDKDAEAFASALAKDRDAEQAKANQLRAQLNAVVTDTQPFLYTIAALLRNHPVRDDGTGVGQLANGAETASLWRELASTWRRLTETLGRPTPADPPALCELTPLTPREQRAWSIYCDESLAATVGKGVSACAGSRWGYDAWVRLPGTLKEEYLGKADLAMDRCDAPATARTGG